MKEEDHRLQNQSSPNKRLRRSELLEFPKRIVLGELTNSSDVKSAQIRDFPITGKSQRPLKRKCDGDREELPCNESNRGLELATSEFEGKSQESGETNEEENGERAVNKCSYSSSIYAHLRSLEMEDSKRPLPNYMQLVQTDIRADMQEVLVDWLVEVTEEYRLVSDTLYLAMAYLDKFLSSHSVSRNKLQLLGVTCMLIASKYEEINPPDVKDFCYITDNTYTENEVLDMENEVLKVLNFEKGIPTIKNFLRMFITAQQWNYKVKDSIMFPDLQFEFLCWYIAELCLLDYRCVQYLPSVVAASTVFLSSFIIQPKIHPWTMTLQSFSGYKPSDLKECVLAIHELHIKTSGSPSQKIRQRYMQNKFKRVAALPSPSKVPLCYFEAINE